MSIYVVTRLSVYRSACLYPKFKLSVAHECFLNGEGAGNGIIRAKKTERKGDRRRRRRRKETKGMKLRKKKYT
jgi:hypothetical protein